jgi:hypothetical protein
MQFKLPKATYYQTPVAADRLVYMIANYFQGGPGLQYFAR